MLALASLFGFNWSAQTAPASDSIASEALSSTRKRSDGKTIIPVTLKPGGLSKFGYHADNTLQSRHRALLKGARQEGFGPIIRRLSLIATFSKYRTPRYSRIFRADQRWLSRYYEAVKERTSSTRATRGRSSAILGAGAVDQGSMAMSTGLYDDDDEEDEENEDEEDLEDDAEDNEEEQEEDYGEEY